MNSASTLPICLRSLHADDYSPKEVIVVDRFSPDGSGRMAGKMGARVIQLDAGRSMARNVGISHSSGEYVLFLDSDQELVPGTIHECVETCIGLGVDAVKIPELFIGKDFWGSCSALWKNAVVEASGTEGGFPRFYRRGLLKGASGFTEGLDFGEDLELHHRLRGRGMRDAWCEGLIMHEEVGGHHGAIQKYFNVGVSLRCHPGEHFKMNFTRLSRMTLRTMTVLVKKARKPVKVYLGTFLVTTIKCLSLLAGLLKGKAS